MADSCLCWAGKTATQIALQPEGGGLVFKFTVLFATEMLRLSLCFPISSSVCVQRTVDEVVRNWLSLWPLLQRM